MVKKKASDQHEARPKDHAGSADNKDNSTSGKTASPDDKTKESAAGVQPEQDKTVPEEKSPEEKLAEMQDRYLRLSAEFDNYRKRTLREKMELSKYASEDVLKKILPVMDDFERALSHMETSAECAAIKSGIDLIYGK